MCTPAALIASRSTTLPAGPKHVGVEEVELPGTRGRHRARVRDPAHALEPLGEQVIRPVLDLLGDVGAGGPAVGRVAPNPPSDGGLCEGVTTIPSARTPEGPASSALCARMANDSAGVGVYPPRASTSTRTPLAASTSSALTWAGSDSACVSAPR